MGRRDQPLLVARRRGTVLPRMADGDPVRADPEDERPVAAGGGDRSDVSTGGLLEWMAGADDAGAAFWVGRQSGAGGHAGVAIDDRRVGTASADDGRQAAGTGRGGADRDRC